MTWNDSASSCFFSEAFKHLQQRKALPNRVYSGDLKQTRAACNIDGALAINGCRFLQLLEEMVDRVQILVVVRIVGLLLPAELLLLLIGLPVEEVLVILPTARAAR